MLCHFLGIISHHWHTILINKYWTYELHAFWFQVNIEFLNTMEIWKYLLVCIYSWYDITTNQCARKKMGISTRRFYQRLDSMLDAAPAGLLWVNRGADANILNDLLPFRSNAILKSGKEIFGMPKPSKFNVPGWNEWAKELNAQQGSSEPVEYCLAPQKWSTYWAEMENTSGLQAWN